MAITLVGKLDSTEGTQTIAYAKNIADDIFDHETMVNGSTETDNNNKQNKINEFLYQRSIKPTPVTCGTAANTAQKSVTISGIGNEQFTTYYPLLRVKFTNKNTAANPTLKVNLLDNKVYPIWYNGSAITSSNAGVLSDTVLLMYDGSVSGSEHWDYITSNTIPTDTNTWRNVYTSGVEAVGTGTDTHAMNFSQGSNITIEYEPAGTGDGESSSNDYFNIKISADNTNTATAADNILKGSNSGTEITYAPYSSDTATQTWVGTDANGGKLYLGTQNPTKTNRLNFNGYLYAKKLYSEGTEVKVKQTAVSDPTADGNSTSFIATISQNANGEITVTKKNLGTATTTTVGGIKAGAVGGSAVSNASTTDTDTTKRYAVLLDSNGLAYTNVPWSDTDTTYASGNEITIGSGNAINHDAKLGTTFTGTTAATTISGFGGSGTFKVPVLGINQYGHVTSASEAEISITIPEAKISAYTAPTYPTSHISSAYQTIITNNAIAVNTTYDSAFNKLDNKIAGLATELANDEATIFQAIEDEPRYYAKCTTGTASSGDLQLSALLVESRNCSLLNGTKIDVYFQNDQTLTTGTLRVGGSNGYSEYKQLVYEDALFDTSLINAGTTLALVYDSGSVVISGTTYTGFFRVVGGVGSGGSCDPVTTQIINVNNPIGTYAVGDEIPVGTLLETIIRNMLMVVIDVAKVNPSLSWSWSPSSTYEVGTTVTPTASGGTKTQGNYQSADTTKYTVAEFIANNPSANASGVLTAGSDISASISYPSAYKGTSETSHTFTASYPYTADTTVVPKKSDNTASNNTITAGTASASKSCSYRYKYFVGGTAYLASGNYSSVFTTKASLSSLTSGWCGTGTTTVGTVTAQSGATTMILVLPSSVGSHTATVTKTLYLGQDVKSNWIFQNNITYTLPDNSTTVTYKVYAVHNGADGLQYTDVQFT